MAALTGFEALPPRASGRAAAKRRRDQIGGVVSSAGGCGGGGCVEDDGAGVDGAAASAAAAAAASLLAAPLPPFTGSLVDEPTCYEYLDHTADVQIHSWGASLGEALCGAAAGLWGYMTEPDAVALDASPAGRRRIEARGRDAATLLFNFLDACLYAFASDDFVARVLRCEACVAPGADGGGGGGGGSDGEFYIRVAAYGERFELGRHPQGTEVKAITYSNMQIVTPQGTFTSNNDGGDEEAAGGSGRGGGGGGGGGGGAAAAASAATADAPSPKGPYEIFVIVDI